MKTSRLSKTQLRRIGTLSLSENVNLVQNAKKLGIARNTLKRHLKLLAGQLERTPGQNVILLRLKQMLPCLTAQFPGKYTIRQLWQAYLSEQPRGYRYSQFAYHYAAWKKSAVVSLQQSTLTLLPADRETLQQWRRSADRRKWEKAVILLDSAAGHALTAIAHKIERSPDTVRAWLSDYTAGGLAALCQQPRRNPAEQTHQIALKKENLMRLLHEAPQLHGFNRTSWRLKDLSTRYEYLYGTSLSVPTISAYIRQAGYVFRKARKVLTSPDPDFRKKLAYIQTILQHLGPKEKFFSIDEYGPFSVKMKGGRSLVKRGETKTYPQHQKSKGFLICTAALELSANQLTHFYSRKKDTDEMIKLIELLRSRYYDQEKLYLSWDAAIWHASKKLKAHLEMINADNYRAEHQSPLIELAPLPAFRPVPERDRIRL